jgi:hypothetical protein
LGYKGVRLSKRYLVAEIFRVFMVDLLYLQEGKYLSESFGGLIWPATVSPVLRLNLRIWEGDM